MSSEAINDVAVLGLGTMGHGIAQAFAAAGCHVRCYDDQPAARNAMLDRVRNNLAQMSQAGMIAADSVAAVLERITVCESLSEAVSHAQFVTEAVREDLALKQELFSCLDSLVPHDSILASNSSSYPISQTAAKMCNPERAILTHWFNPPHIVPVVEIVPGKQTAAQTMHTTSQLLDRIGKSTIQLNREIPGFLINRIQIAMYREIWDLVERGIASPEEMDRAIQGSIGLRLAAVGPLQINDFAGLDVLARVYGNLVGDICSDNKLPKWLQELIAKGHFGVKTGQGIYEYTAESIAEKTSQRDQRYMELLKAVWCAGPVRSNN